MYASLAGLASHKLATFKDRLKHVRKGTQLSIAQTSETKLRRQRKSLLRQKHVSTVINSLA